MRRLLNQFIQFNLQPARVLVSLDLLENRAVLLKYDNRRETALAILLFVFFFFIGIQLHPDEFVLKTPDARVRDCLGEGLLAPVAPVGVQDQENRLSIFFRLG